MTKYIFTAIFLLITSGLQPLYAVEILIKYKDDEPLKTAPAEIQKKRLDNLNSTINKAFTQQHIFSAQVHSYQSLEDLTDEQTKNLLTNLNQRTDIEYAEINGRLYTALTPNDTEYPNQWGLQNNLAGINAEAAWDTTTGTDIVVAVLDTGSLNHTDISGRYVTGYDFVSTLANDLNGNPLDNDGTPGRDTDPSDPGDAVGATDCSFIPFDRDSSWHGLSVSSIIAANSNNTSGIAGVNWAARIMPVRVLARCGGSYADIADAIRWAAGVSDTSLPPTPLVPAKILNLSLSGPTPNCPGTLQSAIDDATAAGALIIASAGNDNSDINGHSPGNCNNVLTVAASTIDGNLAGYSNFGSGIDITAPGGGFYFDNANVLQFDGIQALSNNGSTSPTTETISERSGTSFSAPMVSGVASLLYAVRPDLEPARASNILKLTAKAFPTGSSCNNTNCGNGFLDAHNAVRFAESNELFGNSADTINFVQSNICVTETQTASLSLQRIGTGTGVISLSYSSLDGSAIGGNDFDKIDNRIVVWEDGDTSDKTISVAIVDDTRQESAEVFSLVITEVSAGGRIGNNKSAVITIQSDDNAPALCSDDLHSGGELRFSQVNQTINENIGTVNIEVSRDNNSSGEVSVQYRTIAGAATANEDFTEVTDGTLTWADGDSSNKTISITINDDTVAEATENFSVELFNNSSSTIIAGNKVSVVVIRSDEEAGGGSAYYILLLMLCIINLLRRYANRQI